MLKRSLLVCLVVFVQTGCTFGALWALHTEKKTFEPIPGDVEERSVRPEKVLTKEDILRIWGQPKRMYTEEGRDIWIYNHDLAWRGIAPIIFFPIPLLIPAGMNEKGFEFDNDRLVVSWKESGAVGGGICIMIFLKLGFCRNARDLQQAAR